MQHYQHFSYIGLRALRKLNIIKKVAMKLHSKLSKLNLFLIHQCVFVLLFSEDQFSEWENRRLMENRRAWHKFIITKEISGTFPIGYYKNLT